MIFPLTPVAVIAVLLATPLIPCLTAAAPIQIGNGQLQLAFTANAGTVTSIVDVQSGVDLMSVKTGVYQTTWVMTLLTPAGAHISVDNNQALRFSYSLN